MKAPRRRRILQQPARHDDGSAIAGFTQSEKDAIPFLGSNISDTTRNSNYRSVLNQWWRLFLVHMNWPSPSMLEPLRWIDDDGVIDDGIFERFAAFLAQHPDVGRGTMNTCLIMGTGRVEPAVRQGAAI